MDRQGTPDAPLPLPQQAKVGVLGDDDLADALAEAFSDTGQVVAHLKPAMLDSQRPLPIAAQLDVVFVTIRGNGCAVYRRGLRTPLPQSLS